MKAFILTAILAGSVITATAEPAQVLENGIEGNPPPASELCKLAGQWGENAMNGRQRGMAMSQQMDIANGMSQAFLRDYYIAAIQDAYSQPRFSTDRNIQRAIEKHRDKYYLHCYKAYSEVQ